MKTKYTRQGQMQKDVAVVGQALPDNARYGHPIKNRVSLSRLFTSPLAGEDARRAGEGYKNKVILNLIQDLRRTPLLFMNDMRGRFQIKFGMTSLFNKGFTLIELLVVVLIIGILAAVAVPQYKKAVAKSRATQLQTLVASVANASEVYYLERGEWPVSLNDLPLDLYISPNVDGRANCVGDWVPSSTKKGPDFEISLFTGGIGQRYRIGAFFTTGRYQCTGFVYFLDNNSNNETINSNINHKMFCGESFYGRACGSNCDWTNFCGKVMGKTQRVGNGLDTLVVTYQ